MSGDDSSGLDIGLEGEGERAQEQQEAQETEGSISGEASAESSSGDGESESSSNSSGRSEQNPSTGSDEESPDAEDLPAVKQREKRLLFYLTEKMGSEWDITASQLDLTWQQNGDDRKLGTLRHIYPIIIQEGLKDAKDLTADEIAEYMTEINKQDIETTGK